MGSVVKSVVKIALPIALSATPLGPIGAGIVGGAVGGLIDGGGLKGALFGAVTGGVGGALGSGKLFGSLGGAGNSLASSGATAVSSQAGGASQFFASSLGGNTAAPALTAASSQTGGLQSLLGRNVITGGNVTQVSGIGAPGDLANSILKNTTSPASQGQVTSGTISGAGGTAPSTSQGLGDFFSNIGFNKENAQELLTSGIDYYTAKQEENILEQLSDLQQYVNDPTQAVGIRNQASAQLKKLANGELPASYDQLISDEEKRLERIFVAQGHNPAGSGFGAKEITSKLGLLKAQLLKNEQEYYSTLYQGTAQIATNQNTQQIRSLQELGRANSASTARAGVVARNLVDIFNNRRSA